MRKKDDEKQKNIKDAVIKLILEEGFHGASMSKIAKEAGVSPATVYIYYQNKEAMLQDIYVEYSEDIFYFTLQKLAFDMEPSVMLERIIYNYYTYIKENQEIFHFVDQFSSCPSLSRTCSVNDGKKAFNKLLDEMKCKNIIKGYRNETLIAILLAPVKSVAMNVCSQVYGEELLLSEITKLIQEALLVK